jgi:hypothetical protein
VTQTVRPADSGVDRSLDVRCVWGAVGGVDPAVVVAVCSSGYARHSGSAGLEPVETVPAEIASGAASATAVPAMATTTVIRRRVVSHPPPPPFTGCGRTLPCGANNTEHWNRPTNGRYRAVSGRRTPMSGNVRRRIAGPRYARRPDRRRPWSVHGARRRGINAGTTRPHRAPRVARHRGLIGHCRCCGRGPAACCPAAPGGDVPTTAGAPHAQSRRHSSIAALAVRTSDAGAGRGRRHDRAECELARRD